MELINFWISFLKVPLNLTSHQSNIVIAVKLSYVPTPASEELENVLHIHSDTNKVCSKGVVC